MACGCNKRLMDQATSVNVPGSAPDRPDIAAAREAAQARVAAARETAAASKK